MQSKVLKIGTRESQLAVWQATRVKELLYLNGFESELVYIKSEGDVDLQTPLYEMGVQGIFTRSLDIALLTGRIDLAVHSMKDVPTRLPERIIQSAVLERGSFKDLLVFKDRALMDQWQVSAASIFPDPVLSGVIATSSIRRQAQWLNRYPGHTVENLRGNVNTRLTKLAESEWDAAIFAAAGLERINLRPENSLELDWMLPAPAQGAIVVVCKEDDQYAFEACQPFNHVETALCTRVEKDFLRALMGGCSTPISALARINSDQIVFTGNIFSVDGKHKVEITRQSGLNDAAELGAGAAAELLENGGQAIADTIQHERTY
ncbi:hydroxymethylbilane synthase [Segetibacter sp. 3557_3]|uniref:hydroxymethylbilane synthase n=1 Tax=Segetibacter sp. 3557_3 TaxID=2547429 RepID=UPI0010588DAB|nr:hydroxymethylbilane synthase [Segetibacter sp. 3557_3]TDH26138.1 hydroxymethylbilane synthase [Segetibacter sp. 3557_3]